MKILKVFFIFLVLSPVLGCFKTVNATELIYITQPCNLVDGAFDVTNGEYNINIGRAHTHSNETGSVDIGANYAQPASGNTYQRCKDNIAIASIKGTVQRGTFSMYCSYLGQTVTNTYLTITGDNGVKVRYLHMDLNAANTVANGQVVEVGQVLGTIGSVGCSTFNHIHLDVYLNGVYVSDINQWKFSYPSISPNRDRKAGDFDGNGMKDLIVVKPDNKYAVSLSNGTGFSSSNIWLDIDGLSKDFQWDIADFNGDGKDDLIYVNSDNNYYVSLSNGNSFQAPYSFFQDHGGYLKDHEWMIANLNGDAKKDLVVAGPNNDYYVSISTGSGFNTLRWINQSGYLKDHDWTMADFNNDNKDDLLVITNLNEFKVSTSNGSLFTPAAIWVDLGGRLPDNQWKIADVNGDGKKDVIMATKDNDYNVCRSTSTAFKCGLWQNHPGVLKDYQWNIGDFNGDKKDDLIVGDVNNAFYVSISSGTAFTTSTWIDLGGTLPESQWKIADVNGDGKSDFVLADKNSRYIVNRSTGTLFKSGLWQDHLGLNVDNAWNITDFNNDKKDDLVHVDANNDFYISLSQGTSYTTSLWAAYSGLLKDHQWR